MENRSPRIKQLDARLINLIAAGEVISEPAAIVKELVENSIDAKSKNIEVTVLNAGRTLIRVKDDGHGIYKDDLLLAMERHATSKITNETLFKIPYLGFRGEALPSLAAVTNLTIASKVSDLGSGYLDSGYKDSGYLDSGYKDSGYLGSGYLGSGYKDSGYLDSGYKVTSNFGDIGDVEKTIMNEGCVVSAAKLFYNIPARLKFLKSDRSEIYAINEVFSKMCLVHYNTNFRYNLDNKKQRLYIADNNNSTEQKIKKRISDVLGRDFIENSSFTTLTDGDYKVEVFAAAPTFNAGNSKSCYFFVNSRPVDDKLFYMSVKLAYGDTMPKGRFARLVAYLDIPRSEIDVNVHPSKSEVKFNYPQRVRKLLSEAIRVSIDKNSNKLAGHFFQKIEDKVIKNDNSLPKGVEAKIHDSTNYKYYNQERSQAKQFNYNYEKRVADFPQSDSHQKSERFGGSLKRSEIDYDNSKRQPFNPISSDRNEQTTFLAKRKYGRPIAQVFNCYIIAITDKGILLIDQHAAHERIVYEKLKSLNDEKGNSKEDLLIPYEVNLAGNRIEILLKYKSELAKIGIGIEKSDDANKIKILTLPTILKGIFKKIKPSIFFDDIVTDIIEKDSSSKVLEVIWSVCSKVACYGSVRSGKKLSQIEMESLLDQMEVTPNSSQCNHGRPTYIHISLVDLESLFERT